MDNVIYTILISIGTALAGSFSGWFFGRKKQRIEEIDAATDTFNKIVNSLEDRIEKLLEEHTEDMRKIDELTIQVSELKTEIEELKNNQKRVVKLEKTIMRYEKLLTDNNISF